MATLKTDKIVLQKDFQIVLDDGWILSININTVPTTYTLIHGKKSISFNTREAMKLCCRDYGIRLVRGRRQMVVPSHVLQSFVDNALFLQWYDPGVDHVADHMTSPM